MALALGGSSAVGFAIARWAGAAVLVLANV